MRYIVVGCGRLGSDLASRLYDRGHEVVVIDNLPAAFKNLPPNFEGRMIEGDVLSEDVLHRAGIQRADGLAAVTNLDALNAVVGHLARTVYHVRVVVARNYDPHLRPMHETFGLQVVSSTSWGSQRLEELLYHMEMRTVFSAGNGEVEVYEFNVPEGWGGRKISDLIKAGQSIPVSITRAGRAVLPDDQMAMDAGDVVTFAATLQGVEYIRDQFQQVQGG